MRGYLIYMSTFINGKKDRIGERYGRLLVIDSLPSIGKKVSVWKCKCDCGNIVEVRGGNLNTGNTTSCGCYSDEIRISSNTKHGEASIKDKSPEYAAWLGMKGRCYNDKLASYGNYGGRGITVCGRWLHSFDNFLQDMGRKPSNLHSLDRYPNNETGNYEPSNCRWGTDEQQSKNRRSNKWYEFNGIRMVQKDWAKSLGADNRQFHKMLKYKSFENTYNHFLNRKLNNNATL